MMMLLDRAVKLKKSASTCRHSVHTRETTAHVQPVHATECQLLVFSYNPITTRCVGNVRFCFKFQVYLVTVISV